MICASYPTHCYTNTHHVRCACITSMYSIHDPPSTVTPLDLHQMLISAPPPRPTTRTYGSRYPKSSIICVILPMGAPGSSDQPRDTRVHHLKDSPGRGGRGRRRTRPPCACASCIDRVIMGDIERTGALGQIARLLGHRGSSSGGGRGPWQRLLCCTDAIMIVLLMRLMVPLMRHRGPRRGAPLC